MLESLAEELGGGEPGDGGRAAMNRGCFLGEMSRSTSGWACDSVSGGDAAAAAAAAEVDVDAVVVVEVEVVVEVDRDWL